MLTHAFYQMAFMNGQNWVNCTHCFQEVMQQISVFIKSYLVHMHGNILSVGLSLHHQIGTYEDYKTAGIMRLTSENKYSLYHKICAPFHFCFDFVIPMLSFHLDSSYIFTYIAQHCVVNTVAIDCGMIDPVTMTETRKIKIRPPEPIHNNT